MKKLKLFISIGALAALSLGLFGFNTKPKVETAGKGKFVLRWSGLGDGCNCPNCKCPGCPCPLGMCGCGGVSYFDASVGNLNNEEGSATFTLLNNGKMTIAFDQPTAVNLPNINQNDVVPISGDIVIDRNLSSTFGYSLIRIKNGFYEVNYNAGNPFGIITVTPELIQ